MYCEPPQLLERDFSSLFIAWEVLNRCEDDSLIYELQMMTSDSDWTTLSTHLRSSCAKKKNLSADASYQFRVRCRKEEGEWTDFSMPSEILSVLTETTKIMHPPMVDSVDTQSAYLSWTSISNAVGYRLRMRTEGDVMWTSINSTLTRTNVRKKGLQSGKTYFFSVLPVFSDDIEEQWSFSLSSTPVSVAKLSPFLQKLFPVSLLTNGGASTINSIDILADKLVLVYFSAH
jgi:hypothetical protein